jgi:hydrogenase maturation protease
MDLAYELQEDYDAAILVDAVPRGGEPGTLYVIEPDPAQAEGMLDAHSMDPVRVLGLAKVLGSVPPRVLVVGCEPGVQMAQDDDELRVELSPAVKAATLEAVDLVESVLAELLEAAGKRPQEGQA